MLKFTKIPFVAVLIALMTVSGVSLFGATITFEDLPDAHFFSSGGQNIGTFYPGLDFEPNVTALSVTRCGGFDNVAFPTHSGDVAIWDASDDSITISFAAPQDAVGIWYTSLNPITLSALDSTSTSLGAASGNANTDGTTGASDFISFSGSGISAIQISSVAGQYILDDLQFTSGAIAATPEPATVSIAILGILFLLMAS